MIGDLGLFQFQVHHPWTSYKHNRGAQTFKKVNQRNSDKEVSPGTVVVGILKLLWLWILKTVPSAHLPGVRRAAWKTSLDKSNHYFFPWIFLGWLKTAWISIYRDKYPYSDINAYRQTLLCRHKYTDIITYWMLTVWGVLYMISYILSHFFLPSATKGDDINLFLHKRKLSGEITCPGSQS